MNKEHEFLTHPNEIKDAWIKDEQKFQKAIYWFISLWCNIILGSILGFFTALIIIPGLQIFFPQLNPILQFISQTWIQLWALFGIYIMTSIEARRNLARDMANHREKLYSIALKEAIAKKNGVDVEAIKEQFR